MLRSRRKISAAALKTLETLEDRRMMAIDFGDAPDSALVGFAYPTLLGGVSGNPARHVINFNGPRLGPNIDPEPDGQPNLTATGDDINPAAGPDDEDGITVGGVPLDAVTLTPGAMMTVTVNNPGPTGLLQAWFDWNQNGNWEAAEQVATNLPCPPGNTTFAVAVPAGLTPGSTVYSRFRISTIANLPTTGLADNGEVEDYASRVRTVTPGDLDFGDAPDSYRTTLAVNGARHAATPNLFLGAAVDTELDGQPSAGADKDDLNGVPDDEDGIVFMTPLTPGGIATVQVTNGAGPGVLNAWVDFNANGTFDAGELVINNAALPAVSVTLISFPVPATAMPGGTYARFRLSQTAIAVPSPFGPGGFGEVEDYIVEIPEGGPLDFGDAPDFTGAPFQYPTIFAGISGDPARHIISPNGPQLGPTIDAEPDGQPDIPATGDDLSILYGGIDDEDGITIGGTPLELVPLFAGGVAPIQVNNTGAPGLLNAWFDFNQDGDWNDAGEQVATDLPIPAGVTVVPVAIPATLVPGTFLYSRFRLSTAAGLTPRGLAPDGEVEDYRSLIEGHTTQPMDFGDAPELAAVGTGYPTTLAGPPGNGARHLIVAGAPRLGPMEDAEPDGQPNITATGDDAAGVDDEDGVFVGGMALENVTFLEGTVVPVTVINTGAAGLVNAWFDWNQDWDWNDPGEQVAINVPAAPGINVIPVAVPIGAYNSNLGLYSRFRIDTAGGLTPAGPALDGEVEDYRSRVLNDLTPPTVVAGTLQFETDQSIVLSFSEALDPLTVSAADLTALNTDDGTTPVATSVTLSAGNTVATWVFNTPGTYISDGDYSFTLAAGAVSDPAGNGLAAAYNLSGPGIFFNAGDANRDRSVNIGDFAILAANFNKPGTFSQGNFNYLGNVNIADFAILASKFNTVLPRPAPGSPAGLPTTVRNLFGTDPINKDMVQEVLA